MSLPPGRGLLLWGGVGVGKTYALAAWIRFVLCTGGPEKRLSPDVRVCDGWGGLRSYKVERISFADVLLKIRGTFDGGGSEERVLADYRNCGLLVLEDLGTAVSGGASESDFSVRILEGLLDYRLEHGLPTFVTSNKSPDELGKSFDERIASRLAAACEFVAVKGRDRRRQ